MWNNLSCKSSIIAPYIQHLSRRLHTNAEYIWIHAKLSAQTPHPLRLHGCPRVRRQHPLQTHTRPLRRHIHSKRQSGLVHITQPTHPDRLSIHRSMQAYVHVSTESASPLGLPGFGGTESSRALCTHWTPRLQTTRTHPFHASSSPLRLPIYVDFTSRGRRLYIHSGPRGLIPV
jgi:hypothetical protein